ncbi:MAG: tetratricopeptide repeat protein, partial [Candidatus Rokuibacteriota bacterium]
MAEVTGTATQDDLLQLRAELAVAQQGVQRARAEVESLSAQLTRRIADQGAESMRQAAAQAGRLEALTATVTAMGRRVDELNSRVETLQRSLRSAVPAPPPPRPAPGTAAPAPVPPSTATAPAPTPPASVAPAPAPPVPTPPAATARPTTGALGPQDIYQGAYIDYSKASYGLAIAGFREFIRRFPEHELADNAQYWIGEAQFGVARAFANGGQADKATEALEQAVQEFRRVVANYPRGDKAPAALYKEALALLELNQPAVAKARLQYLVDNFPQAEETPLARERLT